MDTLKLSGKMIDIPIVKGFNYREAVEHADTIEDKDKIHAMQTIWDSIEYTRDHYDIGVETTYWFNGKQLTDVEINSFDQSIVHKYSVVCNSVLACIRDTCNAVISTTSY